MLASVVIRTYNEQKHLEELLLGISAQRCRLVDVEVIVVDSGSSDNTLAIAERYGCKIVHINKSDFTFGRSLNMGCAAANGDFLAFISGHCIPFDEDWIDNLCEPLINQVANYVYGRQVGRDTTKYSESRHFDKWFPEYSKLPQQGYFCNNANAAIVHGVWEQYGFDEELTGLEDMALAKQLVDNQEKIGYVSKASVFHIHDESWRQVRIRYEREAYALHHIMPEVHFSYMDFFRYLISGVLSDFSSAVSDGVFYQKSIEIIIFRFNHYWGTYAGHHKIRKLSAEKKKNYFYPTDLEKRIYQESSNEEKCSRTTTAES